ncbi:tRNA pseudouridine(38-40) synthase TruA [Paracoccus sediminicola]|uniref:tRNA pseudouridine(38-40) synthase TruA n=1 Tax=Paracoccus sediminicola TaxID=3017783 RepID=UPI0022F0CC9A|nr:tRNA pseudouridine(38-40) synthase TruA [Paracoccus sediminicola]WBU56888.1 tRNA pseudouridine(38-40) synthase TruA [Paracoccus sediminicola]
MPRYAFRVEYDGAPFAGWQAQSGQPSVQGAIESALARLDDGFAKGARIAAAGRTDAGVHASGQVFHADLSRQWKAFRLGEALNWHLKPAPVAVTAVASVSADFHARFSALERRYLFRLVARRAPVVADRGRVWQVLKPLDVEAMHEAAQYLVGRHDFTTFRSTMCQAASPVKTLDEIRISAHDYPAGQEIRFHLRARSFLHNQVRSIVGTLERVGTGAWEPARVRTALEARERAACGPVCPPQGLSLSGVTYDPDPFDAA